MVSSVEEGPGAKTTLKERYVLRAATMLSSQTVKNTKVQLLMHASLMILPAGDNYLNHIEWKLPLQSERKPPR